jgi:uncharacterized protein (TIGR02996 family)
MNTAPDPTGAALYAAILAHPDEDALRLVYADYLEEHGDSDRAEFIRAQCRLAAMNVWDDGFSATDARCRRLIAEHPEWLDPLKQFPGATNLKEWEVAGVFARGFPERVRVTAELFRTRFPDLCASVPLRAAWFGSLSADECKRLAPCPGLARLRKLDVSLFGQIPNAPAEECLRALSAAQHLAGLDQLSVYSVLADLAPLKQLVESPHLRALRAVTLALSLTDPTIDPSAVARWNWFPNLRELAFENCYGCDGLIAGVLGKSAWVPRLERLALPAGHDCGRAVFEAVADGRLGGLVDLRIERVHAHPGVLEPVLQLTRPQLQSLRLPDLQPGFVGRGADVTSGLYRGPWLRELRWLELPRANLRDSWLIAVADAPFAKVLRVLDLRSAVFEPTAYRNVFGPARVWPELQHLNLWSTKCPEDVLAALIDHPGLPNLVSLTVGRREPAPMFLLRLAKSPVSARFRELDLLVKLDEATASALLNSPHLEGVEVLRVMKGTAGRTVRNRLARRFGARLTVVPN